MDPNTIGALAAVAALILGGYGAVWSRLGVLTRQLSDVAVQMARLETRVSTIPREASQDTELQISRHETRCTSIKP